MHTKARKVFINMHEVLFAIFACFGVNTIEHLFTPEIAKNAKE